MRKYKTDGYIAAVTELLAQVQGLENRRKNRLVIDRRYWQRGTRATMSFLLTMNSRRQPRLCCLGFHCLEGGMPVERILDRQTPAEAADAMRAVNKPIPARLKYLTQFSSYQFLGDEAAMANNRLAFRLMEVNDAVIGQTFDDLNDILPDQKAAFKLQSEAHREELCAALFKTAGVKVEFVN